MNTDWIKPYEPTLHRCMGFGAMLTNTRLLLTRREMKQLPPENDDYPMQIIDLPFADEVIKTWPVEYWAEPRVMDTLNDSKQYDEGGSFGWIALVSGTITLGWHLHRWFG